MLVLCPSFIITDDLHFISDVEFSSAEIVQEMSSFGIASMEPFCRHILITRVMLMLLQQPQVTTVYFLQVPMDR